jgi:hypothetical protein
MDEVVLTIRGKKHFLYRELWISERKRAGYPGAKPTQQN